VTGRDQLDGLRVEALLAPDGERLGLTHAVGYLPSLGWAVEQMRTLAVRSAKRRGSDVCLVYEPLPSPAYPELEPLTLEELDRAALRSSPLATELVSGPAATAARLRAPAARVLHVVAHGVYDPRRHPPGGVLLSPTARTPTGVVYADAIESANEQAELVLLSSCSAGSGPLRAGDSEASTLTGAFLRSGALAVVAPSADVRARPTLTMMARVQREVAAGVSVAEALRRARVELVASAGDDPREYARLHATGLVDVALYPRRAARSGEDDSGLVGWLAAAAVVALIALAARKFWRRA